MGCSFAESEKWTTFGVMVVGAIIAAALAIWREKCPKCQGKGFVPR